MVARERFYPKGYIGSEQAILLMAKTRDPKRWQDEAMFAGERAIWDGLGGALNAEFLPAHLGVLVKDTRRIDDPSMVNRLRDYSDALVEVRRSLHAGDLVAHYCDEAGKFSFILKDGWGGDLAVDILLRGIVDLEDSWRRPILLKTEEVLRLARSLPPAWNEDGARRPPKAEGLKRPTAEKRKLFQKWRESLGGRIPTLSDDISAMKDLGINRDDARQLRKDHPSLPRGKPKK
jgi:hypothetical protein